MDKKYKLNSEEIKCKFSRQIYFLTLNDIFLLVTILKKILDLFLLTNISEKTCHNCLELNLKYKRSLIDLLIFIMILNFSAYKGLIVGFMNQLGRDHLGKPGGTKRPFRPSMRLLRSVHPRSRLTRSEPRTCQSSALALNH